jgi:hypothetical protein
VSSAADTLVRIVGGAANARGVEFYDSSSNGSQIYSVGSDIRFFTVASASSTERMRLDSAGNLGLGVTPSAWLSTFEALQIGVGTVLYNNTNANGTFLGSNFYWNGTNNIYIGSNTATSYAQTGGQHQWFNAASGTAGNAITFTQAMTLDTSGNLLVGITSARANAGDVQVSKGISFPATQSAQTDANTLDDYEEGTFTATIIGTTTAGTGTYSTNSQIGRYTKIGNRVYFNIYLVWTAHTGTGNMRVGGLPFTSNSTTNAFNAVSTWNANIAMTASNLLTAYVNVNANTVELRQYPTGGGADAAIPIDTAGGLMVAGHYEV